MNDFTAQNSSTGRTGRFKLIIIALGFTLLSVHAAYRAAPASKAGSVAASSAFAVSSEQY